ncbi:MAG: hypothetical protein F6J97_05215 [Leptolyngbya sp. SIO4C1]|nr:hypothetical protein [Leptolyngbya sp. SIO4C1]
MFQNNSGAGAPPVSFDDSPRFEEVSLSIQGSWPALQKMVKTLHKVGFAEPNDWSQPQPSGDRWVTVLIRRVRLD